MRIVICEGCGEVSDDYAVDHDGTAYCSNCAMVLDVDDTRKYECYWCGCHGTRDDMVKLYKGWYHTDCAEIDQ